MNSGPDQHPTREQLLAEVRELRSRLFTLESAPISTAPARRRVDPLQAARDAVESLRRSDERFHTCVENMLDSFALLSPIRDHAGAVVDLRIDYLNRAACASHPQLHLEERLGDAVSRILPGVIGSGLVQACACAIETGQPLRLDAFVVDDFFGFDRVTRRFYDVRGVRLDGGLALAWRDVTDREFQRATLAEWKSRYDAAVIASGQVLYDWDARTDELLLSGNTGDLLGRASGQITHLDQWLDLIHPEDRPRVDQTLQHAGAHAEPFHRSYRLQRADGQWIEVSDHGCCFGAADGSVARMVGFIGSRAAQPPATPDGLATRVEELHRANTAKDRFIAMLSHELRTPLTPVLIGLESLEADPSLPAPLRPTLQVLRQNVQLQSRLIDDLLDLNRTSRGKVALELTDVDIHRVLTGAISTCASAISARRIHLELDLAAPHPVVRADAVRLNQILWNLLQNAVKFTPADGRIRLVTRNLGSTLLVAVSDSGIGIPAELLPRIFEPFEQGPAEATRDRGGLGLGLAIARALAELHEGSLTAESPGPGQGSTFTLCLPCGGSAAAGPSLPQARGATTRSLRILLVDDHESTTRILANLLRSLGHSVHTAPTVAEALAAAAQHPLDLLISDLGLPDASGIELLQRLRQRHAFPAIALSGYGMEDDRSASLKAGFARHLTKPVTLDQLQDAIAAAAGG